MVTDCNTCNIPWYLKEMFSHWCKWSLLLIYILLLWSFLFRCGGSLRRSHGTTKDYLYHQNEAANFTISPFFSFSGKHNNVTRSATNNLICCKIFQICQICFRHSSWLWRSTCLLNPKLKAKSATTKHFNTSLENKANATRHKKQTLQYNT